MFTVEKRHEEAHEAQIWTVAWHKPQDTDNAPDTEGQGTGTLITGSLDDTVKVWSYSKGELSLKKTLLGHHMGVISVVVSPNGKYFASSSMDCNISIWDMDSYELFRKIESGPLESWTVQFTQDSEFILTGNSDGKVELFNVSSGKKEKTLETKQKMSLSIGCSPDGKWIACGSYNGLVSLLDGDTGSHSKTLEGHAMAVRALTFSPDSKLLVTASDDKHVKIYALTDFQVIGTISGHSSWVLGVAFSPDGNTFATCSADKTVRLWDTASRNVLHVFNEAHNDLVCALVWGSDTRLCSVGEDRMINIYKVVR